MKINTILLVVSCILMQQYALAQTTVHEYVKKSYMIPMRDGIKLYTEVLLPVDVKESLPILIQRTPYGAVAPTNGDTLHVDSLRSNTSIKTLLAAGYIFVFQDMRGKFKSEGTFEMLRPLYHQKDKTKTDESTDAYDAVDWLVKNISNNNGKVGIFGISYLGYTALDALSNPHPALKTSSPQASPADMFLGDDNHHNGAFRLAYSMEYSYLIENEKESNSFFPFPQFDVYNWYLKLGSLKNVNDKYYHNRLPSWNDFVNHPNYDSFYQRQSMLTQIKYPPIPLLHVGGYYDQEDLNGPQTMYTHLEKKDSANRNFIVLGPWRHGSWSRGKGDSLGKISFGSNTNIYYQQLEKQWFDYWLKGIGDGKFAEATTFQTGSNVWRTYSKWPPKDATINKLFLHTNGTCDFIAPQESKGSVNYVSDPAKPVPYRLQPIEATYGEGSQWFTWQVADQRFVTSRADVISFVADSLTKNLTVTGNVKARLKVSTTGSDADFVVKLIDVYPDFYKENILMSGYEFPVTMEVFRGRFRKSFERPQPFKPNQPEEITIDLHQINHVFLKGHKIMVQIQSTWFPLIDRNPQKYVSNIFEAKESDFIKATETIYCNKTLSTYIELPVVGNQ